MCTPYTCDPQTGGCFDICNGAAECDSGHACDAAGSCGQRLTGAGCKSNSDCASGFCSDGVCCNAACRGACVACNVAGRLGTCVPIDAGRPDPRGVCTDQGAASCGHDGTCDGNGGCANYSGGTQCLQPSCVGNHLSRAATCDGMGTCTSPGIQDCHPFRCVGDACTGSCQTDNDCDTGVSCMNGSCGPKPIGAICAAAGECASSYCVDGVCCASACTGACYSCALPTSPGSCLPIAAGHVDARGVCQDGGAGACSTNGRCDGSGGCQKYQAGTVCAAESCSSSVYSGPSTCNTTGQCVAPDALPCSPYVCNGSRCFETCIADAQCLTPNRCASNSCGQANSGAACSTSAQCKSGFCAQGVCCDKACTGTCQSCALAGTVGVCTSVANGNVDPSGICKDQGPSSCGTNGRCQAGSCQSYVSGTVCKSPSCPSETTTFTAASTCDGAGTCVTPAALSCFPFLCGSNACKGGCASNADCVLPAVCTNGSCGLKSTGGGCASGAECVSGFCSQGVCCSTVCNGACQSCALTATHGICTNVSAGASDPQGTCHDQGSATCGQDGVCDGNGGCRRYPAGAVCVPPSCPAGASTRTTTRTCDGHGACQSATTISCAPYLCNGTTACKAACTGDADCLAPNVCDPQTNLCGNKKRLGQSCASNSDCLTGDSCTDGVCCIASACPACQACNVAGSQGNCSVIPNYECAPPS